MAAEKPRVFTRTRERDGRQLRRVAHTPAEVVKFVFDGWTEVTGQPAARAVAKTAGDEPAKAAGDGPAKTDTTSKK